MAKGKWAISFGLALLSSAAGCVSCGHQVCKPVIEAAPNAEAPLCDRNHVYVFLVNGLTPGGSLGLDGLRMRLAECGYEKTYRVEVCHAGWATLEMKRVLKCDPSARFVVVGYDLGAGAAMSLGRRATRHEWPLDAVVLLDPVVMPGGSDDPRTIIIRSGSPWTIDEPTDCVCVSSAGHWSLPAAPLTVETIAGVLKESAAKVEHPPVIDSVFEYEDAPNRFPAAPIPEMNDDWSFLRDQPGTYNRFLPTVPCPEELGQPLPTPRQVDPKR